MTFIGCYDSCPPSMDKLRYEGLGNVIPSILAYCSCYTVAGRVSMTCCTYLLVHLLLKIFDNLFSQGNSRLRQQDIGVGLL